MATVNYACLAKEVSGEIHYILPKTHASIVEYTTDQSVEEALDNMSSRLGNVSSAIAADYYNKNEVDAYLDSLYSIIKLNSVSVSPTYSELGSTQSVVVSWAASRKPYSLTVNGTDRTAEVTGESGSFTYTGITADTTYSVSIKDHKNNGETKTATTRFVNKIYYGQINKTSITGSDFNSLTSSLNNGNKTLASTAITFNGAYFYYCYPKRLGNVSITANGLPFAVNAAQTVSFTNPSGYTEDYYIIRSQQLLTGKINVAVANAS